MTDRVAGGICLAAGWAISPCPIPIGLAHAHPFGMMPPADSRRRGKGARSMPGHPDPPSPAAPPARTLRRVALRGGVWGVGLALTLEAGRVLVGCNHAEVCPAASTARPSLRERPGLPDPAPRHPHRRQPPRCCDPSPWYLDEAGPRSAAGRFARRTSAVRPAGCPGPGDPPAGGGPRPQRLPDPVPLPPRHRPHRAWPRRWPCCCTPTRRCTRPAGSSASPRPPAPRPHRQHRPLLRPVRGVAGPPGLAHSRQAFRRWVGARLLPRRVPLPAGAPWTRSRGPAARPAGGCPRPLHQHVGQAVAPAARHQRRHPRQVSVV